MDCQIEGLPDSGCSLSPVDRLFLHGRRKMAYLRQGAGKAVARPSIVLRWAANALGIRRGQRPRAPAGEPLRRAPLGLQPGDQVRVRSRAEIDATLDRDGTCRGLGYIPEAMDRFVGQTLAVRKRVGRFFDERDQRLLNLKNVVILEDSFCEPPADSKSPFAGCDRSCYLFWKEDWLERMDGPPSPAHPRARRPETP